jgi:GT2 family glycosyltransferase
MIYIVIPVHNRKHFTRECLFALQKQTILHHKVIIVDDGSTDGTREMLEKEFPDVFVLEGDGNLFWTAAVNIGIRYALSNSAEYVVTMNNDGYPAPDFLAKMLFWSQQKPDALFCSFEIDATTKKPYYGGEVVNWTWITSTFLLDVLKREEQCGIHEVSVAPGRGLFIPRKVFDAIGLFEEKLLPHYMADYDYACLAKRKGFELYCNYDAVLFTYSEESGDKMIIKNKSILNYFNHLFSIKGAGNLKNFTIYTFRNSPPPLIPFHLFKGYSQRIMGYFLK